ncbi:MAG TPA: RelA/SpoT family protein, partial [Rhodospirillales bacterium]|nr:RelA/SpoT family protein [Rhodospirillales bacterium]
RLHNMRTLHHIDDAVKRRRIALETAEIYAFLAERIGIQKLKSELEDLAFAELNTEARNSIVARLEFLRKEGGDMVTRILAQLRSTLSVAKIPATVTGREKRPYSIWRKMQRRNIGFEQLSDIMAFRVVVATVADCYKALGVIHGAYPVVPERFKDYISTPKPNNYQSLHTSVFGPERQRIEVQIRTSDMHDIAERGVAIHWQYKQGASKPATEGRQYRWLRELLDILDQAAGAEEFLEHTKLEMFQDQVFCFTPRGDLINLPQGATPVDFAYAVHSEVGNTCVGAKINGRMMPLRSELRNGDQVEIITSTAQTPSPTWEQFVITGKARSRIRRFIRGEEHQQYLQLGQAILEKAFDAEDYKFSSKALSGVLKGFNVSSADHLCAMVGAGHHTGREVIEAVFPGTRKRPGQDKVVPLSSARVRRKRKGKDEAIAIKGLIAGMAMHFAGCCHPLPGDRIVGIVTTGKGVTIHTIDCEMLVTYVDAPERWLDVSWQLDGEIPDVHVGRIQLTVINEPGCLGSLSMVIGKNEGNISNLKITNRSADFFDLMLDIEVRDVRHLTDIVAALRATPTVNSVERGRG